MVNTQLNRHTRHISRHPSAPLTPRRSGELSWKANIDSLLGCWCNPKILIANKLIARNWQCEPLCSLCDQSLKLLNTCVCTVSLHGRFGPLFPHGLMVLCRCRCMVISQKNGGTLRYMGDQKRNEKELPHSLFTQPETCGRNAIARSLKPSQQRQQGFLA